MDDIETKPSEAVPPPAHGYAAQPWIAEPTRAGWWWLASSQHGDGTGDIVVEIAEVISLSPIKFQITGSFRIYELQGWGRWAGPIEQPEPPSEGTPHTDASERLPTEDAR